MLLNSREKDEIMKYIDNFKTLVIVTTRVMGAVIVGTMIQMKPVEAALLNFSYDAKDIYDDNLADGKINFTLDTSVVGKAFYQDGNTGGDNGFYYPEAVTNFSWSFDSFSIPKLDLLATPCAGGCQADADTLVFGIPGTSGGRLNTVPVLEVSLAFPKGSVVSASGLLSSSLASYQDLSSGFFVQQFFEYDSHPLCFGDHYGGGCSLEHGDVVPVPEPESSPGLLLAGLGLVWLSFLGKKGRRLLN